MGGLSPPIRVFRQVRKRGAMDEQLEAICRYLDGHRLVSRTTTPRQMAAYLRDEVQPKLDRLAELEAKKKS
jgi:hypothetical protein